MRICKRHMDNRVRHAPSCKHTSRCICCGGCLGLRLKHTRPQRPHLCSCAGGFHEHV